MRGALAYYQTTIGMKIVMAVSGLIFWGFVIVHMLGNLKIYLGPENFNHYAEWLRTVGAPLFPPRTLLWLFRIVLITSFVLHVYAALALKLRAMRARDVDYRMKKPLVFSFASRTMFWGGIIILLFVAYHLLDLTFGTANPDFVPGDVYHNTIATFSSWPVALFYSGAVIFVGLHMYHGLWSSFQTLGANNPKYNVYRRPLAAIIALIVVVGNISIPVAVLTGILS